MTTIYIPKTAEDISLDDDSKSEYSLLDQKADKKDHSPTHSSSYSVIQDSQSQKPDLCSSETIIIKEKDKTPQASFVDEVSFAESATSVRSKASTVTQHQEAIKTLEKALPSTNLNTTEDLTKLISKSDLCILKAEIPKRDDTAVQRIQGQIDALYQANQGELMRRFYELSTEHIRQNNYQLAITALTKITEGCKHSGMADLIDMNSVYERLALCYYKKRNFAKSAEIVTDCWIPHLEAHEIQPTVAVHLSLGKTLRKLAKYGEAIAELVKAYHLQNDLPDKKESKMKVALILLEMSKVYRNIGQLAQAEDHLKQCQEALKQYNHKTEHLMAIVLQELANVCIEQFKYQEAYAKLHEALEIYIATHGLYSLHTARCYCSIAVLSFGLKDFAKAHQEYQKTMTILDQLDEKDNLLLARALSGIGDVHNNNRDYQKALSKYEQSLAIKKKVYKQSHPEIGAGLCKIAELYCRSAEYNKCLQYLQEAQSVYTRHFGAEHRSMININHLFGHLYSKQGKYREAVIRHQKELSLVTKLYGNGYPELVSIYRSIALAYDRMEEYEDAKRYYQKIVDARETNKDFKVNDKAEKSEARIRELNQMQKSEQSFVKIVEETGEIPI